METRGRGAGKDLLGRAVAADSSLASATGVAPGGALRLLLGTGGSSSTPLSLVHQAGTGDPEVRRRTMMSEKSEDPLFLPREKSVLDHSSSSKQNSSWVGLLMYMVSCGASAVVGAGRGVGLTAGGPNQSRSTP